MSKIEDIEPDDVVFVTVGQHKGRIGFCDEIEGKSAIIYFGNMFFADGYFLIQKRFLRQATIADLLQRQSIIGNQINSFKRLKKEMAHSDRERYLLFAEYNLIESTLYERNLFVRYGESSAEGKRIFIAHSKKDVWFANRLTADLKLLGHDPWLDEIKIKAGDSIPEGIQKGLEEAHYQVVILSTNSSESQWVKIEWMSKFMEEVEKRKTLGNF